MEIEGLQHPPNTVLLLSQSGLAEVLVIIESRRKRITVNVAAQHVPPQELNAAAEYTAGDFVDYYIGGASSEVRERYEGRTQRALLPRRPVTC